MTYGHLQADCLYTGISSGPNARYWVWEAFTFFLLSSRWKVLQITSRETDKFMSKDHDQQTDMTALNVIHRAVTLSLSKILNTLLDNGHATEANQIVLIEVRFLLP